MKIKEVIVVEGRDDLTRVKEAVDADVFTTSGYGYGKEILDELKNLYKNRGLIIITDPDGPGRSIRDDLLDRFPDAKAVDIPQKYTISKGVGIENVPAKILKKYIMDIKPTLIDQKLTYTSGDLYRLGLISVSGSKERRESLKDRLALVGSSTSHILDGLNNSDLTEEEIIEILEECDV